MFTRFSFNVSMTGGLICRTSNLKNLISCKTLINNQNWKSKNSTRCFSVSSSKNMKLLQYTTTQSPSDVRVGYLDGDNVVDINKADPSLSSTLLQILQNDQLQKVKQLSSAGKKHPTIPLSEVQLLAPITGMDKVLCIGLNYKDHCDEQHLTPPRVPMIFNKFPSTVVGQSQPVRLRTNVTQNPAISPKGFSNHLFKWRCFSHSSSNNIKLLQFTRSHSPCDVRVGYLDGDNVVDINEADPSLCTTLLHILQSNQIQRIKQLSCQGKKPPSIPLKDVQILAPITSMDKVLCVGLNYRDHCEEHKIKPPPVPMIFNKFPSTVVGPSQPVRLRTKVTQKVDWEVELTLVIGKRASFIKASEAYDYVAGYTIAQDISARDWQKDRNAGQFLLGKAMDTFCPIGPWMTTTDEIPDPESLKISCSLNGAMKQRSRTDQLVHKIPDVLERITSVMTLLPGDILLTGTPGGVGMYRNPPEYLKPGDVLTNEIEKIGILEVKCVEF